MIKKNKIFIAEKSQETRRDRWGGGTNPYFDSIKMFMDH